MLRGFPSKTAGAVGAHLKSGLVVVGIEIATEIGVGVEHGSGPMPELACEKHSVVLLVTVLVAELGFELVQDLTSEA